MELKNYYYNIKKDNDKSYINKYLISLDIEGLKKIKEGLINNCSHITHKKYETTEEPNYFDTAHIKNYQKKELGTIGYNDFFSPDEVNYLVEYDYYEHSKLVRMIDVLLLGNTDIIDIITKDDLLKESTLKDVKIPEELLKSDIDKLIEKGQYEEIDILINTKKEELLIREEEIFGLESIYLAQIKKCIKMNLIAQIEIEEFHKINKFFKEADSSKNISKGLRKILKPIPNKK